jgi:uncharacterized protein YodC (DUF2158 family)
MARFTRRITALGASAERLHGATRRGKGPRSRPFAPHQPAFLEHGGRITLVYPVSCPPAQDPLFPKRYGKMVGDVVVLKSGGPRMTVVAEEQDSVQCVWFDTDNRLEQATFLASVVVAWEKYVP